MANRVFNQDFEPILLPGETARIITATKTLDVECVAVGALPEYSKDFGALTAATWDTSQEDTNLEMADNELAQLRMRLVEDVQLRFNNLAPTRQWRTSGTDFILRQFPQNDSDEFLKKFMFAASEFFVWEDDTPRFDFYSTLATVACSVLFSGWRFKMRRIAIPGRITIWVSGWPAGN